MNKLLSFFITLTFATSACGQETRPPIQPHEDIPLPPPQTSYYVDTARPRNQIKSEFPYDISLITAAGDTLNSASVFAKNGKPTVLAFWLTTCMPCRLELTAIKEKYSGWKEQADFNFYAISIDFPKNYEQFIKRVVESGWGFPAYYDMNREFQYVMPGELNGLPQTFILDKNGNIVLHKRKYAPGDEDALFETIKSLTD